MINTVDFTNRLKKVMEHHQLSASTFADKVGVQRSSISHILSGRNKPSLDFVLKVTSEFIDVDIQWLLNGTGVFPIVKDSKEKSLTSTSSLFNSDKEATGKIIQRIVVFYADGTFEEFQK
ncbi:MAG: transcriptional regulator with XRE-family HTH domain [Polaribacter sp.]|jgi:transcriptional regulator with XRE-family HTH domain